MKWRVNLAMLMGLVAVLAVGLAAMKVATDGVVQWILLGSTIALLLGSVAALVRRRGTWIGFSVFGWGYLAILAAPFLLHVIVPDLDPADLARLRIDGPVADAANRLHSVTPGPVRPFDYTSDRSSGKPILYRVRPTGMVPLTPAEFKAVVAYTDSYATHEHQLRAASCATWIGLAFQGLAFASLGAVAGQLLDRGNS